MIPKHEKWLQTKAWNILCVIGSASKRDCQNHRKLTSASYLRDGNSGVIFATGKEYECQKCGTKWHE